MYNKFGPWIPNFDGEHAQYVLPPSAKPGVGSPSPAQSLYHDVKLPGAVNILVCICHCFVSLRYDSLSCMRQVRPQK